jgi:hypothetical protein
MTTRFSCPLLCLMSALLALLPGCTTGGTGTGRYVVTAPKSQFYKYGPAQAFGADFALNRGQKVTVVENSFGFSKVTTDDGIAGFMPTEDLAPAPPEPTPQLRSTPRTASRRNRGEETFVPPGRKGSPSNVEPGLPLFEANDLPLPSNAEPPKLQPPAPNPKSK